MSRLCLPLLVVCVALVVGCGKSEKTETPAPGDPKPNTPPSKFTMESLRQIELGVSTYNDVVRIFGGVQGERTNEEKQGLGQGNKFVWKEENKKVYVSFSTVNEKVNGLAWEGFAGK
ncbi:MAG: hypothetical protein L0241_16275 [Planctomycetia bacterium]|nr:hypothetical protein [Planctomycetia bacterium]